MRSNEKKLGTKPTSVVIISDQRERNIAIQAVLEQAGYKVGIAQGLYEGLRLIDQVQPQLVIAGSIYFDGTIANLQDYLQENPDFADLPILAWLSAKRRRQLLPLKNRCFAATILGRTSKQALLEKVHAVLQAQGKL